ncbi:MAG: RNA polymerase sigma factor [Lachnospiraceae bacterium]|nr:RNA polymerase sigma factor [Lachnospiraceae bacterium]
MDKHTFTSLVLEAEPALYHVARSILKDEASCEDAVQNSILKAYEKRSTLKEEGYFKTWLTRIMINECYGILRKRRPVVSYEEYFTDQETKEAVNGSGSPEEEYTELYLALERLELPLRITLVLYYIEGYSVKEIRTLLKIPEGTVKSRLATGRKRLKRIMEGEG